MPEQKQVVTEQMKAVGVQAAHMPNNGTIDPNLQSIMDSLQLSDSNVYRILRGEIQEDLDNLNQKIIEWQQQSSILQTHYAGANQLQNQALLTQILTTQQQIQDSLIKIKIELQHYYKMVPYILMLSPLMWLSNLSTKQVRDIQFRQSLMVQRDRCLRDDDTENGFEDDNFFDSIEVLMHVMVAGGEKGWKSNIIRNEVREVKTTIEDRTTPEKKQGGWKSKIGL